MINAKPLVFEKKPTSWVHSIFTSQGFSKIGVGQSARYRVSLRDSSTESIYWLEVPVKQSTNEPNQARLGNPHLYGEKLIPKSVREAAVSKLYEIADYLRNIKAIKVNHSTNHTPQNGSMAKNEDEIKRLGKEMESMPTNKEVTENGGTPDPIQY